MRRTCKPRWIIALACVPLSLGACTPASVRVALDAQRRADAVSEHIFEAQHDALTLLLFRETEAKLAAAGGDDAARAEALNAAWNDRDLFELWRVQHERAKALRLIGVDLKLFADTSILELLLRQLEAAAGRIKQRIAADAGAAAMRRSAGDFPGDTEEAR